MKANRKGWLDLLALFATLTVTCTPASAQQQTKAQHHLHHGRPGFDNICRKAFAIQHNRVGFVRA